MDFDLTQDQKDIKNVAHEVLGARSPFAKVREAADSGAYDPQLWSELVELGWPAIAVAEPYGGQGLGAVELAVLLEELGYACAATPLLCSATAAAVIQATGSDAQRERWLPSLASGESTAGLGTRELAADAADAAVILLLDGDEVVAGRSRHRGRRRDHDDRRDSALCHRPGRRRAARTRARRPASGPRWPPRSSVSVSARWR